MSTKTDPSKPLSKNPHLIKWVKKMAALCKPDLPWVQDELREYPDEKPRQELYHIYRDMLIQQHTPWVEISGGYEERLQKAVEAVDGLLGW